MDHMSHNAHDGVRMVNPGGATSPNYGADVTWPNLGYPIIDDILTGVDGGARLSIAAGTTVQFGRGDGVMVHGTLTARGTSSRPIHLTSDGATPAPGGWAGISFWNHASGNLDYVHVSNAGGSCGCGYLAAVMVNNATPTFAHTTVDRSAANGIEVTHGGLPLLRHVTLLSNKQYPLVYDSLPSNLGQFSGMSITNNAATCSSSTAVEYTLPMCRGRISALLTSFRVAGSASSTGAG
jgi:hypothetical protein